MSEQLPHMLRTDAQHNRDRIIETARALFARRGIEVTMREIARRTGVGPATLYRRFPTKQQLIDAAFAHELQTCRDIVRDGYADPDPWRGLCSVIERIIVLNVTNQGFVEAFVSTTSGTDLFTEHRESALRMLADLLRRSRASGELRRDIVVDDLVLSLFTGRGLAATPPEHRDAAARRFAALTISALSAGEARNTLPPPPRLAGTLALGTGSGG